MNSYPVIHPELTWRLLDGEAVIVSPTTGEIRVLNQVGANIWQHLAEGSQVNEIEKSLVNEYSISSQQAKEDISKFLDDLTNRGLISWKQDL